MSYIAPRKSQPIKNFMALRSIANVVLKSLQKNDKKNYLGWKFVSGFSILIVIIESCLALYLSWYYNIPILEVEKLVLRMAIIKSEAMVFSLYDPYVPKIAKLGPDDWQKWPQKAVDAKTAIENLQILRKPFADTISLNKADIHFVDDRAAAFAYQPDVSELRAIRERYRIPSLLDNSASQITHLATLNDWVRRQWIHGTNGPVNLQHFNAIDIIENARKGAQYWCQIASMVFTQTALSMGYQGRLLSLSLNKGEPGHAVAEVWVDDLNKWVVFDTDFNLYYVDKSGSPLNALELHRILMNGTAADLRVIKGEYRPEQADIENTGAQPLLLPFYRYFYLDMRNDWLSNPYFIGHPKRSDYTSLRWQDSREHVGFLDLKPKTSSERDMYWSLNQVEIRLEIDVNKERSIELAVYLKTITPNFDRFEVSMDGLPAISQRSSRLIWPLRAGTNTLMVQSVNTFGIKGPPSVLHILWDYHMNAG
jgi:hypothetical protein